MFTFDSFGVFLGKLLLAKKWDKGSGDGLVICGWSHTGWLGCFLLKLCSDYVSIRLFVRIKKVYILKWKVHVLFESFIDHESIRLRISVLLSFMSGSTESAMIKSTCIICNNERFLVFLISLTKKIKNTVFISFVFTL